MSSDEKTKLVPGGGNATRTRTADDSCELKVSAGGYGSGQPRASLTTQHSGVQPMRSSQLLLVRVVEFGLSGIKPRKEGRRQIDCTILGGGGGGGGGGVSRRIAGRYIIRAV